MPREPARADGQRYSHAAIERVEQQQHGGRAGVLARLARTPVGPDGGWREAELCFGPRQGSGQAFAEDGLDSG